MLIRKCSSSLTTETKFLLSSPPSHPLSPRELMALGKCGHLTHATQKWSWTSQMETKALLCGTKKHQCWTIHLSSELASSLSDGRLPPRAHAASVPTGAQIPDVSPSSFSFTFFKTVLSLLRTKVLDS